MTVRPAALPASGKLTYDDYVKLPDDGRRYEILDGELAVSPSPTSAHQYVSLELTVALATWVRSRGLGRIWAAPLDLILAPTVVVQPDVFFISSERSSIVSKRGVEAAPDLVIEILSESTAGRDRDVKMRIYARHGVPRYWIVDADARTIEIYALGAGAYELTHSFTGEETAHFDMPAGFVLPLKDVWPSD